MIQGQGFIDHDEISGEPYAGLEVNAGSIVVKLWLADKASAASFRQGMNTLIDELIKTKPKLVVPKGPVVADGRKAG